MPQEKTKIESAEFERAYSEMVNADTGDICSPWAEDYVKWAKAMGLFISDGDGNYRWGAPVTREEICAILYRLVRKLEDGSDAAKE